jgi:hypothetical protein
MADEDRDVIVEYLGWKGAKNPDVGRVLMPEPGIWQKGEKRTMPYRRAAQMASERNTGRTDPLLAIHEIEPEKPAKTTPAKTGQETK